MTGDLDLGYVEVLTEREQEVLRLLARGASNKDIADALVIEVSTVKWYNAQIYGKLEVRNRAQAVIRARTLGILADDGVAPSLRLQHNLPADTLPFIGRSGEIQYLAQQLTDERTRLITLLGPGGIGKTRLAIEVGRCLLSYYADGVYFVPLASVNSEDHIITTIAEIIGFKFYSNTEAKQMLLEHLRKCQMLLIIDNFEHLLDCGGFLTAMLRIAPNVKVLVTSRELLDLSGEQVYSVQGLPVPPENFDGPIVDYDSVKLFIEVAQRRNVQLVHDELSSVARICRLLGGMPLAVVLAAAWIDTLSIVEIEAEIERGLGILEGSLHDAPARQQNMEAVFDSSWARLEAQEQTVFMRLSVFRGGFTREAADAVAGASLRDLRQLVHTSFLQHLPSRRYVIHELMRQYGQTKLAESGELQEVRERHAQFFAELIRPLSEAAFGKFTREMLEIASGDYENLRAAWLFQAERQNTVALRRFLDGLCMFYDSYNRNQEGIDLFEPLLTVFAGDNDDFALFRGQLIARLFWYYSEMGQLPKSIAIAEQSLEILQAFAATEDLLLLYFGLIQVTERMNNMCESLDYTEKFYALAQTQPDSKWHDLAYLWKYLADSKSGNYKAALDCIAALHENAWQIFFRAVLFLQMGDPTQAETLLLQGLNTCWLSPVHYMFWYGLLIACAVQAGDYDKAWRYVQGGLQYADNGYYAWATFSVLISIIPLLIAEDQHSPATELVSLMLHHPSITEDIRIQTTTHKNALESTLPSDEFDAAWVRGKQLNLADVITAYMEL